MGTKDPDFPDPAGEGAFIASQTGGTLSLIDGAGHYPQTEMPDQTGPIILDFLKQHAAERVESTASVARAEPQREA